MRVAVVGGGIVGLSVAYFLAERGAEVTLLERDRCGEGTSQGNTGWITPGVSSEPLAAPGVAGQGLRWMLKPSSPLRIEPRPSLSLARWLWAFWRSSRPDQYTRSMEALVRLNASTVEILDRFRSSGVSFEMHSAGLLFPTRSPEAADKVKALYARLREAGYRGEVVELGADEVHTLEPALAAGITGGVYSAHERHVRPESVTAGLVDALRRAGVAVREGTAVSELRPASGVWRLGLEAEEEVEADAVVVAAGAWSQLLLARVGVRIALLSGRGYSVTAVGTGAKPERPLYVVESRVALSPYDGDAVRIGGMLDLTTLDLALRKRRLDALRRVAADVLLDWRPERVELEWAGLRPLVPDSLPVCGGIPGRPGLYVATGHGMIGMTAGPPSARELSKLILDGQESNLIRPFLPNRRALIHR